MFLADPFERRNPKTLILQAPIFHRFPAKVKIRFYFLSVEVLRVPDIFLLVNILYLLPSLG